MDLFISHSILDAQSNSNFGVSSRSRWCVRVQIWWLLSSRQTVILEHWTGALPSLSATYHDCFYIHAELLHHRSWGLLASQVQRLQCLAAIVWMNRTIQAKTRRAFSTSCRPSYWSNSFGCQSTVTATITSRRNDFVFGLGFCIDCRHWVWTPRIAAVATQVYLTKMMLQIRNLHVP